MKTTVLLLMITTTLALAGGPWTQEKGKGYIQLSGSFIPAYTGLYSNGPEDDISLNREISDQTYNLYAEYGIRHNLTLILEAPWKSVEAEFLPGQLTVSSQEAQQGSESALGNLAFAVKQGFGGEKVQFAGQIRLELNTATSDFISNLNTGYDTWSAMASLSAGQGSSRSFWFANLGFNYRNDDYSHELIGGGEAGWLFFDRIWLIGALAIRNAITDGTATSSNILTGLYHDNQEYVSPGLKLIWQVTDRWGINYSRFGAVSGNLVAQQASTTVGIFVKI